MKLNYICADAIIGVTMLSCAGLPVFLITGNYFWGYQLQRL